MNSSLRHLPDIKTQQSLMCPLLPLNLRMSMNAFLSGSSVGQQAVVMEKQCFDHSLNQNDQHPLHFKEEEEETGIGPVADQHQETDRTNPQFPLTVQVKTEDTTYKHPISPNRSGQDEDEEFGPSTSISLEI